ncbi:glucose 1-dehydrogenase [Pseudomonas luteola]|uniref:SDR family oxidoreductase n=1 Tax=Pseudomonas TaxID=286 RepID=UPI000F76E302|nr:MULTISPECIES: SDR family oxidoreductase [Pseudomonas]MCG7372829.1 SDR family oxidoreductase [Pseudomonas luteola]RRW48014.1 glucose 1-dehydrogenase [Pseudomonas luteola]
MSDYPTPPMPAETQPYPGYESQMNPRPDFGEQSYKGSGRLKGKAALITGGDSGIGRAVALAFAREGADVAISYLSEDEDARETARLVTEAGRKAILIPGDLSKRENCLAVVQKTVEAFGRIDVLVNNAAFQMTRQSLEEIPDEEWVHTFDVNITAMFRITQAAVKHMPKGGSIINTSSINADIAPPSLLAYSATKGAIANFTAGLAQLLAEKGIRANSVAPGPIWTPLIPCTMPAEQVESFGKMAPLGRPGQPVELAPVYVMLASDESSYVSGAMVPVTGGSPVL